MKFEWTIPNVLSISRIIMLPFILYFAWNDTFVNLWLALSLYGVAALTDALDGIIARKLNQQSDFGRYFDPLADKFIVIGVFTVLSLNPGLNIPFWLVLIILLRDLFVTALRNYCLRKKIYFQTSAVAKAKTVVQMIVIAVILAYMLISRWIAVANKWDITDYRRIWEQVGNSHAGWVSFIPLVITVLTVVFTVYTAIDYYVAFKNSLKREDHR